jgi:hypothetical protein
MVGELAAILREEVVALLQRGSTICLKTVHLTPLTSESVVM